jgi:hypothetical protein
VPAPGVDLELLAQRKLHEGLILSTSEEREEATEDRDRENRCGPTSRFDFRQVDDTKAD